MALTAPSPDARHSDLQRDLVALDGLDLHALRLRWRQRLRISPPAGLGRSLLLRLLAYRVQAKVLGDLAPDTIRILDRIAKDNAKRRTAVDKPVPKAVPPIPAVPRDRSLKPGTLLVREHAGVLHRVVITDDGFAWNGVTYASLSEIARAITGTRWNGPRFFGLRDRVVVPGSSAETVLMQAGGELA